MSDFINTADVIGDDVLTAQIVDKTVTEYKDDTITKIREYAFYNCTELETIDTPNAREVGTRAFESCDIKKADFPLATNVAAYAFNGCVNLKTINFPLLENANQIAGYVFQKSNITEAVFPKIKSFGNGVFQYCKQLVKVDFGAITDMRDIFGYNTALKVVIIRTSSLCTLSGSWGLSTCTEIVSGDGYIYVPSALIEEYKAATNWSTVASRFRAIEDYTVDGTVTGALDESKI